MARRCRAQLIWRLSPWSRRCRCVRPEEAGTGAVPAARASLAALVRRGAAGVSPARVGDLADELGRGQDAAAGFGEQLGRELGDERFEFGLQLVDGAGEFADAA